MKRLRTTPEIVAPNDSAILLEIEAVIVARITVRRAAVASLTIAPPRQSRTVDETIVHGPHRRRSTA